MNNNIVVSVPAQASLLAASSERSLRRARGQPRRVDTRVASSASVSLQASANPSVTNPSVTNPSVSGPAFHTRSRVKISNSTQASLSFAERINLETRFLQAIETSDVATFHEMATNSAYADLRRAWEASYCDGGGTRAHLVELYAQSDLLTRFRDHDHITETLHELREGVFTSCDALQEVQKLVNRYDTVFSVLRNAGPLPNTVEQEITKFQNIIHVQHAHNFLLYARDPTPYLNLLIKHTPDEIQNILSEIVNSQRRSAFKVKVSPRETTLLARMRSVISNTTTPITSLSITQVLVDTQLQSLQPLFSLFNSLRDKYHVSDPTRSAYYVEWLFKLKVIDVQVKCFMQLDIPSIVSYAPTLDVATIQHLTCLIAPFRPDHSFEKQFAMLYMLLRKVEAISGMDIIEKERLQKSIIWSLVSCYQSLVEDPALYVTLITTIQNALPSAQKDSFTTFCTMLRFLLVVFQGTFFEYYTILQQHRTQIPEWETLCVPYPDCLEMIYTAQDSLGTLLEKKESAASLEAAIQRGDANAIERYLYDIYFDFSSDDDLKDVNADDMEERKASLNELMRVFASRIPDTIKEVFENFKNILDTSIMLMGFGNGDREPFMQLLGTVGIEELSKRLEHVQKRVKQIPESKYGDVCEDLIIYCHRARGWVQSIGRLRRGLASGALQELLSVQVDDPDCITMVAPDRNMLSLEQQYALQLIHLRWLERYSGNNLEERESRCDTRVELMNALHALKEQMGAARYQSMHAEASRRLATLMEDVEAQLQHIEQLKELSRLTAEQDFGPSYIAQRHGILQALHTPAFKKMVPRLREAASLVEIRGTIEEARSSFECFSLFQELQNLETERTRMKKDEYHRKRARAIAVLERLIQPLLYRLKGGLSDLLEVYKVNHSASYDFVLDIAVEVSYRVMLRDLQQSMNNPSKRGNLESILLGMIPTTEPGYTQYRSGIDALYYEDRQLWLINAKMRIGSLILQSMTASTLCEITGFTSRMSAQEYAAVMGTTGQPDHLLTIRCAHLLQQLYHLETEYPPTSRSSYAVKRKEYLTKRAALLYDLAIVANVETILPRLKDLLPEMNAFIVDTNTRVSLLRNIWKCGTSSTVEQYAHTLQQIHAFMLNNRDTYRAIIEELLQDERNHLHVMFVICHDLLEIRVSNVDQAHAMRVIWNFAKYRMQPCKYLVPLQALSSRFCPALYSCITREDVWYAVQFAELQGARLEGSPQGALISGLIRYIVFEGRARYSEWSQRLIQIDPGLQKMVDEVNIVHQYMEEVERLKASSINSPERPVILQNITRLRRETSLTEAAWDDCLQALLREPRFQPQSIIMTEYEIALVALSYGSQQARARNIMRLSVIEEKYLELVGGYIAYLQVAYAVLLTDSVKDQIQCACLLKKIQVNETQRMALGRSEAVLDQDRECIETRGRLLSELGSVAKRLGDELYRSTVNALSEVVDSDLQHLIDAVDIDLHYSVPESYYASYASRYPEIPPPTCPEGFDRSDLAQIADLLDVAMTTYKEFTNTASLQRRFGSEYRDQMTVADFHDIFTVQLDTFLSEIATREPIPAMPDAAESLQAVYTKIENATLQVLHKIQNTESQEEQKNLITRFLTILLIASNHCGIARIQGALSAYEELCVGQPVNEAQAIIERELAHNRRRIMESEIPPSSAESIIFARQFQRSLGARFAIAGSGEILEQDGQGIEQFQNQYGGVFNKEREAIRFEGRLRPSALVEQVEHFVNDSLELKNYFSSSFEVSAASSGPLIYPDIQEAEVRLQELRAQGAVNICATFREEFSVLYHEYPDALERDDQIDGAIAAIKAERNRSQASREEAYRRSLIKPGKSGGQPSKIRRRAVLQGLMRFGICTYSGLS